MRWRRFGRAAYCPLHEYDFAECEPCCLERRVVLWRIDWVLRRYWRHTGYRFSDRGRAEPARR